MKKLFFVLVIAATFAACNSETKEGTTDTVAPATTETVAPATTRNNSTWLQLMLQLLQPQQLSKIFSYGKQSLEAIPILRGGYFISLLRS